MIKYFNINRIDGVEVQPSNPIENYKNKLVDFTLFLVQRDTML